MHHVARPLVEQVCARKKNKKGRVIAVMTRPFCVSALVRDRDQASAALSLSARSVFSQGKK
ncbi:hypothetical protein, partial [Sphingomonas sp. 35-24ZXX]|uniref:hypothetical protein n=1 Tax=Sphingomonas sp. 35-24ZXX TaxID=1545915 RepID=UPI00053BE8FE